MLAIHIIWITFAVCFLIFGFHRAAGLFHPVGEGGLYARRIDLSNSFFIFFRFYSSNAISSFCYPYIRLSAPRGVHAFFPSSLDRLRIFRSDVSFFERDFFISLSLKSL